MRIWSVHPKFLDRQALIAGWRESLLAQAVLAGRTKGYRHHPQLERFRAAEEPLAAIGCYLSGLAGEATTRGYRFDTTRIDLPRLDLTDGDASLTVTDGQLAFERAHLAAKLAVRSPHLLADLPATLTPHPIFQVVPGVVEPWERLP